MSAPEIRALLIDMDGLMTLTEGLQTEAFNEMMRRKGFRNFTLSPQEEAFFVGREEREDCAYLKDTYGLEESLDEIILERKEIYLQLVRERGVQPCEGVREFFREAKRRNLKMVVVTNSPTEDVEVVLKSLFKTMRIAQKPEEYFDGIATVSMVEREKPHPDLYTLASQMAGVEPGHCMALEDSESGIRSARSAGVRRAIAVPNEYTHSHDFSDAFAVLPTLKEVLRFL
jgi:HAD superfamily hydrolase (TIGR01509 family)